MRTKFYSGKLIGRDYAEDQGVDGKIVLEWILRKCGWKMWTGFI
jgi:hypothetical protein